MFVINIVSLPVNGAQETQPFHQIGRGEVQSIQWHPTVDYIFVGTVSGAWIYTSDLEDITHIPDVHLAALSPDGRYIAGVDKNHIIQIWDAHTFEYLETVRYHGLQRISTLAWSPDGRYLAVSGTGDESIVVVWDIENTERILTAYRQQANELVWSPNSIYLAMLASHTVFIVNIPEGGRVFYETIPGATRDNAEVIWQDDQHFLTMVFGEYVEATRWDIVANEQVGIFTLPWLSAQYDPTGQLMAAGFLGSVRIMNAITHEIIVEIEVGGGLSGGSSVAVWRADSREVAIGTYSFSRGSPAEILLIDVQNDVITRRLTGARQNIALIVWSSDGQHLVAVDARQQIFVYDITRDDPIATSGAHTLVGDTLAWNPDGTQLAIADTIGGITLWDVQSNQPVRYFADNGLPVQRIKWQPNGDYIAAQGHDWRDYGSRNYENVTFRVWDTTIGSNADISDRFIYSVDDTVSIFGWHPVGHQLAAMAGPTLYIWDSSSGAIDAEVPIELLTDRPVDLLWSPLDQRILLLHYGYLPDISLIYDKVTDEIIPNGVRTYRGTVVWSLDGELVTLIWGFTGDPTPPPFINPLLFGPVDPDFISVTGERIESPITLRGLTSNVNQGFLSPHGRYAAAVDRMGSGFIWDALTGEPLAMLSDTTQVVWSPDEARLVIQRTDGGIWLLYTNGTIIQQLPNSPAIQEPMGEFIWSPDGHYLSYRYAGTVQLWCVDLIESCG